jgi:serine/threonine-protein kinase
MPPRDGTLEGVQFPAPFGRFRLLGLLGEGGMARVFRAELEGPGGFRKPAALKVVRVELALRNDRLRRGLVNEARVGGLLHHPNIVETYDCGEIDGQPWIAMELVSGVPLDRLIERAGALPPRPLLDVADQVCAALEHAHDARLDGAPAGLVHRDLKPSNVLIGMDGVVKVADFGIAKVSAFRGDTTEAGMAKGTPSYMSPEQLEGATLDRRSDLFAMGCVLYEMATGLRLNDAETLPALVMKVVRTEERLRDPALLAPVDARLPGLGALLRACLRTRREDRPADARELRSGLDALRAGLPPAPGLRELLAGLGPEPETDGDRELRRHGLNSAPTPPYVPDTTPLRTGAPAPAPAPADAPLSPPMPAPAAARVVGTETRPVPATRPTAKRGPPAEGGSRPGPPRRSQIFVLPLLLIAVAALAIWLGIEIAKSVLEPDDVIAQAPSETLVPGEAARALDLGSEAELALAGEPSVAEKTSDFDELRKQAATGAGRAAGSAKTERKPADASSPEPGGLLPGTLPSSPAGGASAVAASPAASADGGSAVSPPADAPADPAPAGVPSLRAVDGDTEKLKRPGDLIAWSFSVAVEGGTPGELTLHYLAASRDWQRVPMKRRSDGRWAAEVRLPGSAAGHLKWWVEIRAADGSPGQPFGSPGKPKDVVVR